VRGAWRALAEKASIRAGPSVADQAPIETTFSLCKVHFSNVAQFKVWLLGSPLRF